MSVRAQGMATCCLAIGQYRLRLKIRFENLAVIVG